MFSALFVATNTPSPLLLRISDGVVINETQQHINHETYKFSSFKNLAFLAGVGDNARGDGTYEEIGAELV